MQKNAYPKFVTSVALLGKLVNRGVETENPGGIILNLLQDIDLSVLENQLERRFRRGNLEELDLILLSKGKLVKVLKYKK